MILLGLIIYHFFHLTNFIFNFPFLFQKGVDFIGREALLKQKQEGVKKMYVQLLLNDHDHETDIWSWGGEPIFRNGVYCGMTTTTGYGFTFKKQVIN